MSKKIKFDSKTWKKRLHETLVGYCNPIHQCKKCGSPYIEGYCCDYCDDIEPYKDGKIT